MTNWEFLYHLLETGHARDLGVAFDRMVPDKRHDGKVMRTDPLPTPIDQSGR
jgi:hypothetical protein